MKLFQMTTIALLTASPLMAENQRHADSHEHGVGVLDIAIDGTQIAMEFHAPGADIVGFEHPATSDEDKLAIKAAIEVLSGPLDLFVLPTAAGCSVTEAHAGLEGDEHDDQDDADHKDHDNADHKDHDDHDDDHAEHAHEEDGDADHTEFHAEYLVTCTSPAEATSIAFTYFKIFENAREVEVQLVSDKGATAFEVERDAPVLDLSGHL
ncbi:zinc uptake protein ZrgA [Phaeobacter marinintestinus]|uniref:zinc uptake protein ZrgA n=1 Tax=Falsiphaeobacter marinintestinus TaxID=1492905 RepID=UPI0011B4E447|nr:DUF2796 domain-containing protein [Phaeobacter marinintestinus]